MNAKKYERPYPDTKAPDGITAEGYRIVRAGGWVRFRRWWWHHAALLPEVGNWVLCGNSDYWGTEMDVRRWGGPWEDRFICRITDPRDNRI